MWGKKNIEDYIHKPGVGVWEMERIWIHGMTIVVKNSFDPNAKSFSGEVLIGFKKNYW